LFQPWARGEEVAAPSEKWVRSKLNGLYWGCRHVPQKKRNNSSQNPGARRVEGKRIGGPARERIQKQKKKRQSHRGKAPRRQKKRRKKGWGRRGKKKRPRLQNRPEQLLIGGKKRKREKVGPRARRREGLTRRGQHGEARLLGPNSPTFPMTGCKGNTNRGPPSRKETRFST